MKGIMDKRGFLVVLSVLMLTSGYAQTLDTIASGTTELKDSLGRVLAVYTFEDSLLNGPVKGFYPENDKRHFEGEFENNLPVGEWVFYAYDDLDRSYVYQRVPYQSGKVHGDFIQFENGERVVASSVHGTLDGYYTREYVLKQNADTIITQPIDSGRYLNGKRFSNWKFYAFNGLLYQKGEYKSGMKHRQWFTYDTIRPTNNLMVEQQFFEGAITGKELIHYRYDYSGAVPIRIDEYEQISWQMGTMNGPYVKKNAKGEVLLKGNILDSLRVGSWYELRGDTAVEVGYLQNKKNGKYTERIGEKRIVEGVYAMGEKNGTWSFYDVNGKLRSTQMYDRGTPIKDWIYYNENKESFLLAHFSEGVVVMLEDIDDSGDYYRWDIEYTDDGVALTLEHVHGDTLEIVNFIKDQLPSNYPDLAFQEMNRAHSAWKRNGMYSLTVNGASVFKGFYKDGKKNGVFTYYDHVDIDWQKEFVDDQMTEERFVDGRSKKPYTGDYVLYFSPEVPKVEWEIENGLRNGKSFWFDEEGNKVKKEKYENGVLLD